MPRGAELDLVGPARPHEQVGGQHQALGVGHGEGDVVEARAGLLREDDVVRVPLALEGHHHHGVVGDDVLGQAEAHVVVEDERGVHRRRHNLDVVERWTHAPRGVSTSWNNRGRVSMVAQNLRGCRPGRWCGGCGPGGGRRSRRSGNPLPRSGAAPTPGPPPFGRGSRPSRSPARRA